MAGKRKTHEQFVLDVKEKRGNEIEILGEYNGGNVKILVRYKCGHEKIVSPRLILSGSGCRICTDKKRGEYQRKTTKIFISEVKEKFGDKYTIKGEYVKAREKLLILNNECKHEYMISPDNLLRGKGCPFCRENNLRKSILVPKDVILGRIKKATNGKVTVVGEVKLMNSKVELRCNVCGHEWNASPNSLMRIENGHGCFVCARKASAESQRKTHEEFISEMFDKWGNEFEVLGTYESFHTKILVKHNCNHTYMVQPGSLLSGFGCPICAKKNKSKGETAIRKYLQKNDIEFEQEFRILNDSRRYDFKVGDVIVEMDGEQHFTTRRGSWGKEISLEKQQEIDKYKTELALYSGYKLVRISYTEINNIYDVLDYIFNNKLEDLNLFGKEYSDQTWG